jgi:hypothetical protein
VATTVTSSVAGASVPWVGVAVAVAWLVIAPASRSAWLAVSLARQVVLVPGAAALRTGDRADPVVRQRQGIQRDVAGIGDDEAIVDHRADAVVGRAGDRRSCPG